MMKFKIKVTYIDKPGDGDIHEVEYIDISSDSRMAMLGVITELYEMEILNVSVKFLGQK